MSKLTDILGVSTGLRSSDLKKIISTAPNRYKIYLIDKRSGGMRVIAQPTPEVKFLQRALVEGMLSDLPVHPSATAYRKGVSLLENARPHAGIGPILKMDLKEFFPSIKSRDWRSYCIEHEIFEEMEDIYLSERLLFYRAPGARLLRLSIGAPSSPIISNILMRNFDEQVVAAVSPDHVTYTRYADDMTFSGPRTGHLVKVKSQIAKIVRGLKYPKLEINSKKTTYVTSKFHRTVTGLTLANDGRVTLGRELKRKISAGVHHISIGDMDNDRVSEMAGYLAYAKSIEPDFIETLSGKYGSDVVDLILKVGPRILKGRRRRRRQV